MNNLPMFNKLMNHIIQIGNQMKSTAEDFHAACDYGVYKFLKAEMMEQYGYSGMISAYIKKMNKTGVMYSEQPAPMQGTASLQGLQNILEMEHASIKLITEMITKEDMVLYRSFLSELYCDLLREYREISDIVNDMNKIASNPSALIRYDDKLYNEYCDYKYKYYLKYKHLRKHNDCD